jgi:hypothetical protein
VNKYREGKVKKKGICPNEIDLKLFVDLRLIPFLTRRNSVPFASWVSKFFETAALADRCRHNENKKIYRIQHCYNL